MQVCGCGPFSRFGRDSRRRNTKTRAASPHLGETTPLVGSYSIVTGSPAEPRRLPPRRKSRRRGLDYRRFTGCSNRPATAGNLAIIVVAGYNLLDVVWVVVMVFAFVADVPPVAAPVVATGSVDGDGYHGLSLELDSSRPLRSIADDTVPVANLPRPVSASGQL